MTTCYRFAYFIPIMCVFIKNLLMLYHNSYKLKMCVINVSHHYLYLRPILLHTTAKIISYKPRAPPWRHICWLPKQNPLDTYKHITHTLCVCIKILLILHHNYYNLKLGVMKLSHHWYYLRPIFLYIINIIFKCVRPRASDVIIYSAEPKRAICSQ